MNLLDTLSAAQRRTISLIREIAVEKDCRPYLVGGPVRDLLLGRSAIDLDITLEQGGSTLARALAKQIGGRVRSFPQFLTYKVTATGHPDIDIATARKERYRTPGALPMVSSGRLRDDLLRRDFSINAIAFDLLDESLHDPAGGARDIEARLIRVLHDGSFIDDPTRIFRAIRLAVRLQFQIEDHTRSLIQAAITGGALATVSRERLWRELFFAMEERDAAAVLSTLREEGALESLFGRRTDGEARDRLAAVQKQAEGDPELDRYVLYTGVLLRGDASPVDFEGSGFSQKRARAVIQIANDLPLIEEALSSASDDRSRFAIYRKLSPETLAVVALELPDQVPFIQRLQEFARFTVAVRGNDLGVPPGPHVAEALEKTREAVFSGEVPPDEARAFARDAARTLYESSRVQQPTEDRAEEAVSE
jgi:tRNA nucleotidyltransferase (CCA-adding enzyme)